MAGAIVGLVLGSIIGAVATIAGSYFLFWRRRHAALAHLRRAFRTELSALSYIDEMAESGDYETLTQTVEKPVVYESNADDIGHLSGEEVEALVAFYTDLYWICDQQDIEDKKDRVHEIVEKRQRAIETIREAE
ncbi:hypothetical protein GCM10009037_24340 [Halarchaeum grantii]|uniref:Uncharacterized protein n=1 Tax=Halarchaeum grantii TaxID=1193105 RepID=A0A830EXR0_9EURY|nr:hypothetical protein [Halarchaeum grantii]GGL39714.1 hypothetical protein GCM10009037_24340 [Halarchaeum grantii]